MNQRTAIIDLGTNTFNLLITEETEKGFTEVYRNKISVRLGQGGLAKKYISTEAQERAFLALQEFQKRIIENQVTKVKGVATAAVRSAKNGKEFVSKLREEFQWDIEIIDGLKEAELIWLGVSQAVEMTKTPSLIIDIGGGSVELIIADDTTIIWKESFPLGAARLLQQFPTEDPIEKATILAIENHMEQVLQPLIDVWKKNPTSSLIGSSGSFDTLADMIAYQFHNPSILAGKTSYEFNMKEYAVVSDAIMQSTTAERRAMKGMIEMRVDMMVIATIIVNFILEKLDIKNMTLSTYSLKEGVLKSIS